MATKKEQKLSKTLSPGESPSQLPDHSVGVTGEQGSVIQALVESAVSIATLVSGTVIETKEEAHCSSIVGSVSSLQSKLGNEADDEDDSVVAVPSPSKRRVFHPHTALQRINSDDSSEEELDWQQGTTFAGKKRYQRILRNRPLRYAENKHTADCPSELQTSDSAPRDLFSPLEYVGKALIRKISGQTYAQGTDTTSPTERTSADINIPNQNTTTVRSSATDSTRQTKTKPINSNTRQTKTKPVNSNTRQTKAKPVDCTKNTEQNLTDSSSNAIVAVLRPGCNHDTGDSEKGTYFCCREECPERDRSNVHNTHNTVKRVLNCITCHETVHRNRTENAKIQRDDEPENSQSSFKTTQPTKNEYDDTGWKTTNTTGRHSDRAESTVRQGRKSGTVNYIQQSKTRTKVQDLINNMKKNDHDRNQKHSNTNHNFVSPRQPLVVNTAVGFYDEISTEGHTCVDTSKAVYNIPEASHTRNKGVWHASHYSSENEKMCSTICASQVETNEERPAACNNGEGAVTCSPAHEETRQSSDSSQVENNCVGPVFCNKRDGSTCKPSVSFAKRHGAYPPSCNRAEHATAMSIRKSYCSQYDHRFNKDASDLTPTCSRVRNEEKHSRPFSFSDTDRIGDSLRIPKYEYDTNTKRYESQRLESQYSSKIQNTLSDAEEEVRKSRRVKFQDNNNDKYAFDSANVSLRDGQSTVYVDGPSLGQTHKTKPILKNLTSRISMLNPATDDFHWDARSDSSHQFLPSTNLYPASKRASELLNNDQWDANEHDVRSQNDRSWDSIYANLKSRFKLRKVKDMYGSDPILNEILSKRNIPYLHDQFMDTRGNRILGRKMLIGNMPIIPPDSKPPAPPRKTTNPRLLRCPILIREEENSTDVKQKNPKEKELDCSCEFYEQSSSDKTDASVDTDVKRYRLPSLPKRITLYKVGHLARTISAASKNISKTEKENSGISLSVLNRNNISAVTNTIQNHLEQPKVSSESERSKCEKRKHVSSHVISCNITGKGSITALSENRVAIELTQVLDWKFTADSEHGQEAKSLGHFSSKEPNPMSRQSPRVNYCDNYRNRLSQHSCYTSPETSSEIKLRATKSTGSYAIYQNRCSENYSLSRDLKNYQLGRSRFDTKIDRQAHFSKSADNYTPSREQSICLLCAAEAKQLPSTGENCSSDIHNIGKSVQGLPVEQCYDLSAGPCTVEKDTFSCATQVRGETREHRFETEDAQRMDVERNDGSLCATRQASVDTVECSSMSTGGRRKCIKESNTTSTVIAQEQHSAQEAGTSGEGDREAIVFSVLERGIDGSYQTCHKLATDLAECEPQPDQTQAGPTGQSNNFNSQCSHTSFPPVLVNPSKVDSLDCLGGHQSNHFMDITLQMAGGEEALSILREFSKGKFSTKEETACGRRLVSQKSCVNSRNSQKSLIQRCSQSVKTNNNQKNSAVKALKEQAIQWEKNVLAEGVVWYRPIVSLSTEKAFDEGSVPDQLPTSAALKNSDNVECMPPLPGKQHLTNSNSDVESSSTENPNLRHNQTFQAEDGHVLRFIFSTTTVNREDTSGLETSTSKVVRSVSEHTDKGLSEIARKETHIDQLGDQTSQQDTDSGTLPHSDTEGGTLPHSDTPEETDIAFVGRQAQKNRPCKTNTNAQTKPSFILNKTAHSDYDYSHFERVSTTTKRQQHVRDSGHSRHIPDAKGQHIGKVSHLKTSLSQVTDSQFSSRHTPSNRVTPEEKIQTLDDIEKMYGSKKHGVGPRCKQADMRHLSVDRTPEPADTGDWWTCEHPLIEAWKLTESSTEACGVFIPKSTTCKLDKVKCWNSGSSAKEFIETQDLQTDRQVTGNVQIVLSDGMEESAGRNESDEQNDNCSEIIDRKETVNECRNKEKVKASQAETQPFGHGFYDTWKAEKIRKVGRIAKKTITRLPKASHSSEQKGGSRIRHRLLNGDRKEKVSHKQEINIPTEQRLGVHDINKVEEDAAAEHPSCSTQVKSSPSAGKDVSEQTTCVSTVKFSYTSRQKYASDQNQNIVGAAKDTGLEQFPCVTLANHAHKFEKNVSSERHPRVKKIKRSSKVRKSLYVDSLKSGDKLEKHVVQEQAQCIKNEEKSHELERCASTGNLPFDFSAKKPQTWKYVASDPITCVGRFQSSQKPVTDDASEPPLCTDINKREMSSEKDITARQRNESLQEQSSYCEETSREVTIPDVTSECVSLRESGKNKQVAETKKKKRVRMDGKRSDIQSNLTDEHYRAVSGNWPKSHIKRRTRQTKVDKEPTEIGHKQVKRTTLSAVAEESGGDYSETDCASKQTQDEACGRGSRSDSNSLSECSLGSFRSDMSTVAVVHSDIRTISKTDSPSNAPPVPTDDSRDSFDVKTRIRELEISKSIQNLTNDLVLRGKSGQPNADRVCNKNSAAIETSGKMNSSVIVNVCITKIQE